MKCVELDHLAGLGVPSIHHGLNHTLDQDLLSCCPHCRIETDVNDGEGRVFIFLLGQRHHLTSCSDGEGGYFLCVDVVMATVA